MPRVRAAVLHGIKDLRVEDIDILHETLPPNFARIQIKCCGVCMSDVHFWQHGAIAHFVVNKPMVIGHECSGIVAAVGSNVTHLQVGDKVAIEAGVPCMDSRWSKEGRYNLDPQMQFYATPPTHGGLAATVDHPAAWCYKIPNSMSLEEAALCEPLSVGVYACKRAGVAPGKKVAILGAGPIGLVTILASRAFGADTVAITDHKEKNLKLAEELGADVCHLVASGELPETTATVLKERANLPDGFDVVIDCAGFEDTMRVGIKVAVSGGKLVLVGMGQNEMRLPLVEASIREVDILGSFRYANTYPTCIDLISRGKINVKPLITHRFGFDEEQVLQGFETAKNAAAHGAIKVMFNL